jgi:hypothetical protein
VLSLTPAQRTLRARVAAYARAAKYDGREVTRPAYNGRMAKLAAQVDPEGTLPEIERQRRAYAALRSQMSALSLKASRKRTRKAAPAIVTPEAAQEADGGGRRRSPAA